MSNVTYLIPPGNIPSSSRGSCDWTRQKRLSLAEAALAARQAVLNWRGGPIMPDTPKAAPRDYDEDMRIPGATPQLLTKSVVCGGTPRREPAEGKYVSHEAA